MIALMNKKPQADRHKPAKMVRVQHPLAVALLAYCERNVVSFPVAVNQAVREMLEKNGMWPPQKGE